MALLRYRRQASGSEKGMMFAQSTQRPQRSTGTKVRKVTQRHKATKMSYRAAKPLSLATVAFGARVKAIGLRPEATTSGLYGFV
jgi:hypothetical protein